MLMNVLVASLAVTTTPSVSTFLASTSASVCLVIMDLDSTARVSHVTIIQGFIGNTKKRCRQ